MNIFAATQRLAGPIRISLFVASVSSLWLAGCASAPQRPVGAAEARSKLTQLQGEPALAGRAPVAIQDAENAVRVAETPQPDAALAAHRVYLADRKVDTARALAETRYAEDQRAVLQREREGARLDARTQEADAATREAIMAKQDATNATRAAESATRDATAAQAESARQRQEADAARAEAEASRNATLAASQQAQEMQQQIDALQAKVTDRGIVLNLGDVLFASGNSALVGAAHERLDKLVLFLDKYADRTVAIEGHTDSVGSEAYNQGLSERRAESVSAYLRGQGVAAARITASGKGEDDPVAGNDSNGGRQQNRRVEVIIANAVTAQR